MSLWALKKSLEYAGFESKLLLVNYSDVGGDVNVLTVHDINPDEPYKKLISTSKLYSYAEFKNAFRDLNDYKEGETWEVLEYLKNRGVA